MELFYYYVLLPPPLGGFLKTISKCNATGKNIHPSLKKKWIEFEYTEVTFISLVLTAPFIWAGTFGCQEGCTVLSHVHLYVSSKQAHFMPFPQSAWHTVISQCPESSVDSWQNSHFPYETIFPQLAFIAKEISFILRLAWSRTMRSFITKYLE